MVDKEEETEQLRVRKQRKQRCDVGGENERCVGFSMMAM